jgi:hypothetical protein
MMSDRAVARPDIDSDDDFQASLSALYAALDQVRVNGKIEHDHNFELDSLPPGNRLADCTMVMC